MAYIVVKPHLNVKELEKAKLYQINGRFPYGIPTANNANYLWISLFFSRPNKTGRWISSDGGRDHALCLWAWPDGRSRRVPFGNDLKTEF
jgi:hypothetical protein